MCASQRCSRGCSSLAAALLLSRDYVYLYPQHSLHRIHICELSVYIYVCVYERVCTPRKAGVYNIAIAAAIGYVHLYAIFLPRVYTQYRYICCVYYIAISFVSPLLSVWVLFSSCLFFILFFLFDARVHARRSNEDNISVCILFGEI